MHFVDSHENRSAIKVINRGEIKKNHYFVNQEKFHDKQ